MTMGSTITGYPRIGPDRELKFATEAFWADRIDEAQLLALATELRASTWAELADAGLDSIPGNTFSFYDHVLDTAALFGVLPARFTNLGLSPLRTYFAAARGHRDAPAMELTKWFDTNYHYLVPEIGPETVFTLAGDKPLAEYAQARDLGITTRPVLLGPLTFLLLSKSTQPGFAPLEHLDALVEVYAELLARLHEQGCEWVQLDEPALVADRTPQELAALGRTYHRLGALDRRPRLLVSGYYGDLGPALSVLAGTAIEAIGLDLVTAPDTAVAAVPALRDKIVLAGVVDGRNIWATDLPAALGKAAALLGSAAEVHVTTSCPLLHVPYDLGAETALEGPVRDRLAFARQKVAEVVGLGKALHGQDPQEPASQPTGGGASPGGRVRARVEALRRTPARRADYPVREAAQQQRLKLPPLPTTTIGSFPQTAQVRRARRELEHTDPGAYQQRMREEIAAVIALQEDIGLDVLVHGEAERNDMVQYFADHLDGIASTQHGWVQSYGSRCVRPPIIHSDVTRPDPITVAWSSYAQSLTTKPVKGMLTGPVTILAWSFVRDDQALADTAAQLALFLREEIRDLEAAGIIIVQVDEPALRELLPLRRADQQAYLDWAVDAFRLATAGAEPSTQIHTHLCYSEFGEVIEAINALDADVTTIEAARSRMEVLDDLEAISFSRGIGPGVYDIHSPQVPTIEEMTRLLSAAARTVPAQRLWANPDCGLKTRGYTEVEPALRNLVAAAQQVRAALQ